MFKFISEYRRKPFATRKEEHTRHINDGFPVIVEFADTYILKKNKYIFPSSLTLSEISYLMRKRTLPEIPKEAHMTAFICKYTSDSQVTPQQIIMPVSETLENVYIRGKSDDNALYIIYRSENTFGGDKPFVL